MPKRTKVPTPVNFITITNGAKFDNTTCGFDDENFDDDIENSTVSAESWSSSSVGDSHEDDCSSSDDLLSFCSRNQLAPDDASQEDALYLPSELSLCLGDRGKHRPYPDEHRSDRDPSTSVNRSREHNTYKYRKGNGNVDCLLISKSLTSDLSTASLTLPNTIDLTSTSQSCTSSSVPTAVTFANECLERSHQRRSSTNLCAIPSSIPITKRSRTQSLNEEITVNSSSAESQKLVHRSASPTSTMPSIISNMTSSELSKISEITAANMAMIEDYEHSPRAVRVINIKRKMRSQEIQYYRTKCVRSLRRSMVLSMKINTSDDDESSTASVQQVTKHETNDNQKNITPTIAHSHSAMEVARDILCFNIVLAIMYMFYILYKDSITDAVQKIDNYRWVGVSS